MPSPVEMLFDTVKNVEKLMILPHNNPDPDALASSVALKYLLTHGPKISCEIAYNGIIGRAENKALARYLKVPLTAQLLSLQPSPPPLALVDTQPESGNISLPAVPNVLVVIDDHSVRSESSTVPFRDIRPACGATSTILVEYFQAASMQIPRMLATALFYGIKTNTMGLSRNASSKDSAAYYFLQPKIDVEALGKIEQARVPPQYFKSFDVALRNARLYQDLVFSSLGWINYPDLAAEMADLLLRLERAQWVVCVGSYKTQLMISVRVRRRHNNAEQLVEALVQNTGPAGGHGTIAGGQISLVDQNVDALVEELIERALTTLNIPLNTSGIPLL